ncbi:ANTAR domain-containing protein, partial [Rhodococcus qingshengii]|uniref:ANTAR domain-containing protein n=1 Tax=Rhodococcus qingshengii TaxID=334542 RepID=UPI002034CB74
MIVYGIPSDRAFDILICCSQQQNVKLRRLSEQLIERARTDFRLPNGLRSHFDHLLLGSRPPATCTGVRGGACGWLLNRRHLADRSPSRRRRAHLYTARADEKTGPPVSKDPRAGPEPATLARPQRATPSPPTRPRLSVGASGEVIPPPNARTRR